MRRFLIKLIHFYQTYKPKNTACCRFTPTCSNYMIEAIEKKGSIKGVLLGLMRILKCNPLGPYGYDPVKE